MNYVNSLSFAQQLDSEDPLKDFRSRFFIPLHNGRETIYFTGNSLGLQPRTVASAIDQELSDWATLGVMGHTRAQQPWVSYHEWFAGPLSRIVGGRPHEVVAMNGLTANIHLLFATFYRPTKERFRIICEAKAFPSDQYALQSQCELHGFDASEALIEVAPREGETLLRTEDILQAIRDHGSSVAVVFMGGLNYYTGQVLDMPLITKAAHEAGAYAGFDLAHAAGNIDMRLHDWKVDFACWCSYKYLNSGPGSVAGIYIHEQHATDRSMPRLAGWWGTNKGERFRMERTFDPIPTAEGWQLSNAPVFSMAAHKASLQVFEEAGMTAIGEKSRKLTGFLFHILDEINREQQHPVIQVLTPRDAHGSQVSMFMLERGREVFEALMAEGVIADWREPNVIRIAPVPLYNTFEDVWTFGSIISRILSS